MSPAIYPRTAICVICVIIVCIGCVPKSPFVNTQETQCDIHEDNQRQCRIVQQANMPDDNSFRSETMLKYSSFVCIPNKPVLTFIDNGKGGAENAIITVTASPNSDVTGKDFFKIEHTPSPYGVMRACIIKRSNMYYNHKENLQWCGGGGKGNWVQIELDKEYMVSHIRFAIGWASDRETFDNFNRLKKVTLLIDGSRKVEFSFGKNELNKMNASINLNTRLRTIKIIVNDVYPGKKYNNTCIQEFEFHNSQHLD